jgi:hypothetical protein
MLQMRDHPTNIQGLRLGQLEVASGLPLGLPPPVVSRVAVRTGKPLDGTLAHAAAHIPMLKRAIDGYKPALTALHETQPC